MPIEDCTCFRNLVLSWSGVSYEVCIHGKFVESRRKRKLRDNRGMGEAVGTLLLRGACSAKFVRLINPKSICHILGLFNLIFYISS